MPIMRSMVLERPSAPLVSREGPVPRPAATEILIEVKACGVCRTDLHVVDGELPNPKLPIVPGHEIVGRVAAIGAGVVDLAPGERHQRSLERDVPGEGPGAELRARDAAAVQQGREADLLVGRLGRDLPGQVQADRGRPERHEPCDIELAALFQPVAIASHLLQRQIDAGGADIAEPIRMLPD